MKQTILFASMILGSSFAQADTPLADNIKGTYIFTERGDVGNQPLVGLGSITLDGKGNATCAERIQAEGQNLSTNCIGTYSINADGSASVKLLHTVIQAVPDPSADPNAVVDPQTITVNYRILAIGSSGQMKGIRTDNGASVIADFQK